MRSSHRILLVGFLALMFVTPSGSSKDAASAGQVPVLSRPGAAAGANRWAEAAHELAGKIAARVAPDAAILLTIRNISSLGADEAAEARRALRAELGRAGLRLVSSPRARSTGPSRGAGGTRETVRVLITLSENSQGYIWVAEVAEKGEAEAAPEVLMVEAARSGAAQPVRSPVSLAVRKTLVWE